MTKLHFHSIILSYQAIIKNICFWRGESVNPWSDFSDAPGIKQMLMDEQSSITVVISAKATLKCFYGIRETFCSHFKLLTGKPKEGRLKWKQHKSNSKISEDL